MLAEFSLGPHLSFYVVVVQRRHGYVQNSVIHVESCCFFFILFFAVVLAVVVVVGFVVIQK